MGSCDFKLLQAKEKCPLAVRVIRAFSFLGLVLRSHSSVGLLLFPLRIVEKYSFPAQLPSVLERCAMGMCIWLNSGPCFILKLKLGMCLTKH